MGYLKNIKEINKNISKFNKSNEKISKNCKYLIKHTTSNILAPLKESIWDKGKKSSTYKEANGNKAFIKALDIGYTSALNPWCNGVLKKSDYSFLYDCKDYIVLSYTPSNKIKRTYFDYVSSVLNLRTLVGRPSERNDPLGQFGEFLYCKLFGAYDSGQLNTEGYDVIDPISNLKIQIKVARKAATNNNGIGVKTTSIEIFDKLAIFWLSENLKIKTYFELTSKEVKHILRKKKFGSINNFDIKPSDVDKKIIIRSEKKLINALEKHGLIDMWEK